MSERIVLYVNIDDGMARACYADGKIELKLVNEKYFIMRDGYAWKVLPSNKRLHKAVRVNSGKWYHATNIHDKREYIFRCPFPPTRETHGHIFAYVTGGWSTLEILGKHVTMCYTLPANFTFDRNATGTDYTLKLKETTE